MPRPTQLLNVLRQLLAEHEIEFGAEAATEWSGDQEWGTSRGNFPQLVVPGGIQLTHDEIVGEFIPYGPPKLYEVRIHVSWGPVAIAGLGSLLQAVVTYGVGSARYQTVIDCTNGASLIVSGGPITVAVRQVNGFARPLASVDVSVAAGSRPLHPTFTEEPVEAVVVGPPAYRLSAGYVPGRAVKVRPTTLFSAGTVTLRFYSGATILAEYDSGTDRVLFQTGIPIPAGCVAWQVQRANIVNPFLMIWELQ